MEENKRKRTDGKTSKQRRLATRKDEASGNACMANWKPREIHYNNGLADPGRKVSKMGKYDLGYSDLQEIDEAKRVERFTWKLVGVAFGIVLFVALAVLLSINLNLLK